MHILVATDGTLDPAEAADAVARWYSEGDEVTVFTAMNIPAESIEHLGDPGIRQAATVALEAGQGFTSGDRAAERLAPPIETHAEPPVDVPIIRSLRSGAAKRTGPVIEELAARGISATGQWTTTNNRTARSVLTAVHRYDAGLLVIGSTGHGRFEGLLGSTGTKLVRQSPVSVLVLRVSESG